jgi:hypothetical protein
MLEHREERKWIGYGKAEEPRIDNPGHASVGKQQNHCLSRFP